MKYLIAAFALVIAATALKVHIVAQPFTLPGEPHAIRIDAGLYRETDAVLVIEYGSRRVSLTAAEVLAIVEHLKFEQFARENGGKRK